jgi:hypothetical protein
MKVNGKQVIQKVQKTEGMPSPKGRKSKHDAPIMVVTKGAPSKRFP